MAKFFTLVNNKTGETTYINTDYIVRYEEVSHLKQTKIYLLDGSVFYLNYNQREYTEILKQLGHEYHP
ncbi:MAG TPA: hypothetical protein VN040_20545 [Pseudosphingobacterium sp.]|nr:hypothetical protein [Pseudosphingobacterium sp.]